MIDYREIIRLKNLKFSNVAIANSLCCSRNTVTEVLKLAESHSLEWPIPETLTNKDIEQLFYPGRGTNEGRRLPDYEYIYNELAEPLYLKCLKLRYHYTSSIGKRDYAILLLASRLGMRAGDIASLKLDSLDFKNQRICFIQNKTGSVSELYMVPEIKTALMDYLSTDRPASTSDYVFLKSCAPYSEISYSVVSFAVKKHMIRSGINIAGKKHGPHSLRASLASSMVNDGISYETVRKVLGHDSPNAIRHYARLDIQMLRNCALACPAPSGTLHQFLKGGRI